ncbi:MAG: FGGY-family carbohydrate kinase [Sphaerochaeta sp.]|nr:FGGY-family carbohydrate kinase [Sphaerochaeta sp.]
MILTIDLGTTTLKAALFSEEGVPSAVRHAPIGRSSEEHELDPILWSRALKALCDGLGSLSSVKAVVISGNGPTLVPVLGEPEGKDGLLQARTALARTWLDRRPVQESSEISSALGSFVDSGFFLPKALYLYRNERQTYERSLWLLSSHEYLDYLLTGVAKAVIHSDDSQKWYWSDDLVTSLGLDKEKFPPLCNPGDLIGPITPLASKTLGIPRGIPLFAGAPDFFVSILGTGTVEVGQVCNRAGTSEGINLCTHKPLGDPRLMTYRHPIAPLYNVSGIISTTGKAIEWAKNLVGLTDASFADLYAEMARAEPGSGGVVFLPYLSGERAPIWDPDARALFSGLSLATGKGELLRSVAEGTCFAMRDVITVMEELGATVGQLRITGGPSESPFLNQLKADITGREVLVPAMQDAELMGCLIIALTSLGLFASYKEAANAVVRTKRCFTPDPKVQPLYDRLFATYRDLKPTKE